MKSTLVGLAICFCASMTFPATAGEFGRGFGGCDLSRTFSGCEWKPANCYKPNKPFFFVSDRRSYNLAVDEFNFYLSQVKAYQNCVIEDGKADIEKRFQAFVIKGATDAIDEANDEIRSARSDLELAKETAR